MDSLWTETVSMPQFPALRGDRETDVLIIGGGMAGILCAWKLREAGVDCLLLEADRICGGVTAGTTAKITFQHGLCYDKLIREFGAEKARMYLDANRAALEQYRALAARISCDFEEKDAYVYALDDREEIERELTALHKIGYPAAFTDKLPLPFPVAGAVKFSHQAQFHPLKFAAALARSLPIYEHTPVRQLMPHAALTDTGTVMAKKIIVATHFPFINKHGWYFVKLYQHRSYLLALENGPDVDGMYLGEAEDGMSFRNYKNFLLIGGGDHRTGKKGGGWWELEKFAGVHYPASPIRYRWAAQDCMTLDGVPYIGQYGRGTPEVYVATGFNKWGMTGSMTAAMLLTDRVLGIENPWAPVFSPSRTTLRPQLAVNLYEATANLLTPSPRRCPHLGCALKWNPQEHSWDCPCHGSRFTAKGKLLDNPATGNLKGYDTDGKPSE